ncbi:MAG: winged helix-turn-helix domain-containing protein [Candidatus Heimdallarchaeota archaeon]
MSSDDENPEGEKVQRTLEQILTIVKALKDDLNLLEHRISSIEEQILPDPSKKLTYQVVEIPGLSSSQSQKNPGDLILNFEGLEEHLKETYQTLVDSNQAMTANQLANLRGRKRSTISDHLNQLFKRDLVEKSRQAKEVLYTPKELKDLYKHE